MSDSDQKDGGQSEGKLLSQCFDSFGQTRTGVQRALSAPLPDTGAKTIIAKSIYLERVFNSIRPWQRVVGCKGV
jgi:hypothetical protein